MSNELALIGGDLQVAGGKWLAEECHWPCALMECSIEPRAEGVAIHHKRLAEVGKVEHRRRGERHLERPEHCRRVVVPVETLLAQQSCQRGGHCAVVLDEVPIVPGEAEEGTKSTSGCRLGPRRHDDNLVIVHCHAHRRDHMTQVCDRGRGKGALGVLYVELIVVEDGEHRGQVLEMLGPRCTIDENVVKKIQERTYEGRVGALRSSSFGTWPTRL